MRLNRTRLAVTGAVVGALLLTGCAASGPSAGPADAQGADGAGAGALTLGTMTTPVSLDPKDAGGAALPFFQPVYDTLVLREPDGSFSPMLATSWAWDDTRTRLTLELAEGVAFSDGTPFDAEAVRANVENFRDGGGQQAVQAEQVADVEVVGDHEVVIVLDEPDPALEWSLSDGLGLMASPTAMAAGTLVTDPVGTGPYLMDTGSSAIGTAWVYERNEDYWRDALPFDSVSILVFDNENALVNGLRTGQINSAVLRTPDQQIVAERDDSLTTTDTSFDFQGVLLIDRDGDLNPALADARVRQAMNYAIDRELLVQQVREGRGEVTSQVFGERTRGFDPDLDTYYAHDVERARELLAEAGHTDGVEITLPVMPGITSDALTSALTTQMAEAGISIVWDNPDNAVAAAFRDLAYPGIPMNFGQPDDPWLLVQMFVQPGTFNPFGTSDPELDAHVAALRSGGEEASLEAATAINRHLVEEAWLIPFFRMSDYLVTTADVTAVPQDGMSVPSLYNYAPVAG